MIYVDALLCLFAFALLIAVWDLDRRQERRAKRDREVWTIHSRQMERLLDAAKTREKEFDS